jgi:hypothetical protein
MINSGSPASVWKSSELAIAPTSQPTWAAAAGAVGGRLSEDADPARHACGRQDRVHGLATRVQLRHKDPPVPQNSIRTSPSEQAKTRPLSAGRVISVAD